jgi:hypothetical protein
MYCDGLKNHFFRLANESRSQDRPMTLCVCTEKKFILMKPGKTAGSSVFRGGFQEQAKLNFIYKTKDLNEWFLNTNDDALKNYYIVSLLRNPYDRFVSCSSFFDIDFNQFCKIYELDHDNNFCVPCEMTEENSRKSCLLKNHELHFANYLNIPCDDNLKKYFLKREHIISHTLPLYEYNFANNNKFTDAVIKFETLQDDFNHVCKRIKIAQVKLDKRQTSVHDNYTSYLNNENIKIINKIYKKDFEYFHYELINVNI